jgi:AraC-like DNA-binding protein
MSLVLQIEKWVQKFKPYLISYKSAFFELHYLINSPQDMIQRFISMPLAKHNSTHQFVVSKTPFIDSIIYYHDFEDGLFITYSEAEYKANVHFRCYFNKTHPAQYYCLSLRTNNDSKNVHSLANGISYSDNYWLITKPGSKVDLHNFKGTTGHYISLHFTHEWLENNLKDSSGSKELNAFIQSDKELFIYAHLPERALFDAEPLRQLFRNSKPTHTHYIDQLQKECLLYFNFFKLKLHEDQINEKHFMVHNNDQIKVLHAEQILKKHLHTKFPGIGYLAKETGLSETKLKERFHRVYDNTLLGHFHSIQMKQAKELLQNTDLPIAQIALTFGYKNPSKFSDAFRKHNMCLPSQVKPSPSSNENKFLNG